MAKDTTRLELAAASARTALTPLSLRDPKRKHLGFRVGGFQGLGLGFGGVEGFGFLFLGTPKKAISIIFFCDIPTFLCLIIRGFIWDVPTLIFACVLFGGP